MAVLAGCVGAGARAATELVSSSITSHASTSRIEWPRSPVTTGARRPCTRAADDSDDQDHITTRSRISIRATHRRQRRLLCIFVLENAIAMSTISGIPHRDCLSACDRAPEAAALPVAGTSTVARRQGGSVLSTRVRGRAAGRAGHRERAPGTRTLTVACPQHDHGAVDAAATSSGSGGSALCERRR
eukprot:COSAG02_NODE_470_length_21686_cov_5.095937_5_plen_187_part_00